MTEDELVAFVRREGVGLVGIGAMTRMVARAYRFADALRAASRAGASRRMSPRPPRRRGAPTRFSRF
jgi:hypothetical protein